MNKNNIYIPSINNDKNTKYKYYKDRLVLQSDTKVTNAISKMDKKNIIDKKIMEGKLSKKDVKKISLNLELNINDVNVKLKGFENYDDNIQIVLDLINNKIIENKDIDEYNVMSIYYDEYMEFINVSDFKQNRQRHKKELINYLNYLRQMTIEYEGIGYVKKQKKYDEKGKPIKQKTETFNIEYGRALISSVNPEKYKNRVLVGCDGMFIQDVLNGSLFKVDKLAYGGHNKNKHRHLSNLIKYLSKIRKNTSFYCDDETTKEKQLIARVSVKNIYENSNYPLFNKIINDRQSYKIKAKNVLEKDLNRLCEEDGILINWRYVLSGSKGKKGEEIPFYDEYINKLKANQWYNSLIEVQFDIESVNYNTTEEEQRIQTEKERIERAQANAKKILNR